MFLTAQVFGILSMLAAILCVQARTSAGILTGQILANGFSAASYGLLGSLSGAWVCCLAAIHSIMISLIRNRSAYPKIWIGVISIIFAVAYMVGSVMTYNSWPDIISCICALLFVITIAQENASGMRNVMLFSMTLWIIFDISVGAYANMITHGATIASTLTAKYRLDK